MGVSKKQDVWKLRFPLFTSVLAMVSNEIAMAQCGVHSKQEWVKH